MTAPPAPARLDRIVRHPLKAIGREEIGAAELSPGRPLPFDRLWAVAHASARLEPGAWAPKTNFLRGVAAPRLMAVTARLDAAALRLALAAPGAEPIGIAPDRPEEAARLLAWLAPMWPANRPAPAAVVRAGAAAFTDVPEPWLSLAFLASHRALAARMGRPLSPHRWRANLWIDGLDPWAEFDLIGRELRIGPARLRIEARITRCEATAADPDSGLRDADTLGALEAGWGHADFGVYARVVEGGTIRTGDPVAPA